MRPPPVYTIKPRVTRDGYDLVGPLLPRGLWYQEARQALSYARNEIAKVGDVRIDVYGPNGRLFKTVVAESRRTLNLSGVGMAY